MKPVLMRGLKRGLTRSQGFTLLEVMVSVLMVAIGLLGVAKMQALALSSTKISSNRALIAFQASSLAANMMSNRAHWSALTGGSAYTASLSSTPSGSVTDCSTTACSAADLAAYDIAQWQTRMNSMFPGYTANIDCDVPTGPTDTTTPAVRCTIKVGWTEKVLAINQQTAAVAASAPTETKSYTLYVQP